jgi:uncharacterized protein involved in exopolysaccharide biosynthesis
MSAPGRTAPPSPDRLAPPQRPQLGVIGEMPSLESYLTILWRRRRLIAGLPIVLFGLAGGLSLLRPRQYVARAAFIASEPQSMMNSSLNALSSVAQQLGVPALGAVANTSSSTSSQFYADLLTSATILHTVVTTPYDASSPGEFGGVPFKGTLIDYAKPTGKTPEDNAMSAMKTLSRHIVTVTSDRTTGIVRFQVKTKNRQLSGLIARQLLDLVNEFNLKRRQTQAGSERDFGARRMQASLDSLRAAEAAVADFRAANIDISRSPRLAARDADLQRRVTLAQQIYTTIAQRYEMANIEAVRNTPVVTVIDAPEGLVEAQPRYTVLIALGAFGVGFVVACAIALLQERPAAAR